MQQVVRKQGCRNAWLDPKLQNLKWWTCDRKLKKLRPLWQSFWKHPIYVGHLTGEVHVNVASSFLHGIVVSSKVRGQTLQYIAIYAQFGKQVEVTLQSSEENPECILVLRICASPFFTGLNSTATCHPSADIVLNISVFTFIPNSKFNKRKRPSLENMRKKQNRETNFMCATPEV